MYLVMYRVLIAVVALLLVSACVAVATFGPRPAGGVCTDTRLDREQRELLLNLGVSGEMQQTMGVRCRSIEQSGG